MRRLRARYQNGVLTPLETLPLPEGAEVVLHIEASPLPEDWRGQVHFQCRQVTPISALFTWTMPLQGVGVPRVRLCKILTREAWGTQVLGSVVPPPGAVQVEMLVELPPRPEVSSQEFTLQFVDQEEIEELAGRVVVLLPEVRVLLQDLPGQPPADWNCQGSWERLEDGTWTDSPSGDYPNNADFSLTSPLISLGGLDSSVLTFQERHCLEDGADWCTLEVQGQDGPWQILARYTGTSDWKAQALDLSAYDGTRVRLRFRLRSDRSVTRDGFYFRNLLLAAFPVC
ncbi:MAG: antitoxin AF2212-like protein [Candidatus Xenobium sp.]|jgi:hypothetical protein|nr:DUF104 domain-containing protein [Burkholderiales bacterium]